uniref:Uncharacterized protein n=1 Tax=Trichuris muris TaxID=70415 RepID=A0A5S6QPN0_TRIMR
MRVPCAFLPTPDRPHCPKLLAHGVQGAPEPNSPSEIPVQGRKALRPLAILLWRVLFIVLPLLMPFKRILADRLLGTMLDHFFESRATGPSVSRIFIQVAVGGSRSGKANMQWQCENENCDWQKCNMTACEYGVTRSTKN